MIIGLQKSKVLIVAFCSDYLICKYWYFILIELIVLCASLGKAGLIKVSFYFSIIILIININKIKQ
jgi:hypothetical protein